MKRVIKSVVFTSFLVLSLYMLFSFVSLNLWWVTMVVGEVRFFFSLGVILSIVAGVIFYEENK